MSLDIDELAEAMIGGARDAVKDRWPQMQAVAEVELRRLASSLAGVADLVAAGKIDQARARKHAHIHQLAARSVLTTVEGLGILTAEQVMHAALRNVSRVVNGVVKFALL